jgi:hypothetical protein
MGHLLNNNRSAAVVAGGIFFLLAAALMHRVDDSRDLRDAVPRVVFEAKS